jgi:hypothetical protein
MIAGKAAVVDAINLRGEGAGYCEDRVGEQRGFLAIPYGRAATAAGWRACGLSWQRSWTVTPRAIGSGGFDARSQTDWLAA